MITIYQIVIQISVQLQVFNDHDLSDSYSNFKAIASITQS